MSLMKEQTPQQGHALREVFNGLRYGVRAGCFEAMAHDLRAVLRTVVERSPQPSAAIYDSRILQSTPESGPRAAYDGYKRRKGSKVHIAVDTLGHLLALKVTPANEQDRAQVGELTQAAAASHGVLLEVVKLAEAKRGFVLLPRRWVVERSFGWAARFRRLSRDHERLATTLAGAHWLAFAGLMLANLFR